MATDKIAKTVFTDIQKEKLRSLVDNGIVNDVSKRNTNIFETTAAEMNLDPKSVRNKIQTDWPCASTFIFETS